MYSVQCTSRTWGVENGIGAALASGFDGLAVLASTISTSAVEMVKQHKLVNHSLVSPGSILIIAEVNCLDWQQWGGGNCYKTEEFRGGRSHCGQNWAGPKSRWWGLSENAIMCLMQHFRFWTRTPIRNVLKSKIYSISWRSWKNSSGTALVQQSWMKFQDPWYVFRNLIPDKYTIYTSMKRVCSPKMKKEKSCSYSTWIQI